MSLEVLIGAQLAVALPGPEATETLIGQLRELHAQSLVIFSRNVVSPEQFARLVHRLEDALERRLLLLVDHEGGRVVRFREGLTRFPDALTVGRTQDAEAVERQGTVEAQELKQLGIRVNLAPCVDVLVDGADPVIGDRSYGADPSQVSALAVARIRGLQSHGVAACAKHFPGLGAVPRDPHQTLPTISLDWPTMDRIHLAPFRHAIEAGVATVMSSHVCYPAAGDPAGLPATCSQRLIRGLLRERMGFSGAILTDDLAMGALRSFGTIGEAAVQAAAAGHDLFLVCSDLEAARSVFAALRSAHQEKRLRDEELHQSLQRIERLRWQFLLSNP